MEQPEGTKLTLNLQLLTYTFLQVKLLKTFARELAKYRLNLVGVQGLGEWREAQNEQRILLLLWKRKRKPSMPDKNFVPRESYR